MQGISPAGVDQLLGIYIVRSLPGHVVIASAALRLQKWQSGVGPGEKKWYPLACVSKNGVGERE